MEADDEALKVRERQEVKVKVQRSLQEAEAQSFQLYHPQVDQAIRKKEELHKALREHREESSARQRHKELVTDEMLDNEMAILAPLHKACRPCRLATLTSPGIWPLKKELKGEEPEFQELPHPTGRGNYGGSLQRAHPGHISGGGPHGHGGGLRQRGPLSRPPGGHRRGGRSTMARWEGPMTPSGTRRWRGRRLRRCWMGSKLSIGYMRQPRRDPPLRVPLAPRRGSSNLNLGAGSGRSRAPGKAHRRVKVLRKDWRFQVASLGEEWWVNKVGTYGMASAQSYWGRLAALLLRVLYALFPQVDWNFVFVDDFLWLLQSEGAVNLAVALLATLLALGTPLSWKKTHLAEVNTWLGFVVHPNIPQVLMPANKHMVMEVLQIMVEGQAMHSKERRPWQRPHVRWRNRCSSHFGPGRWPPPRWGNPLRWSGCWRSCCGSSSTRLSSSTPPTCRSPPGGVAATLVPRTTDWHLWEVGAPTRWSRTRCTGSMSRSMWRSTLGLSRMGIQSGGLQLWRCWARSSSVT